MIDAHVHVWTLDAARYPWQPTLATAPIPTKPALAEDLIANMDRDHITHAVVVQPSTYGWDNSYLCDSIERFPKRLVGVCLVDPLAASAPTDLRHWCEIGGCRGVRINLPADVDGGVPLSPKGGIWPVAIELGIPIALQLFSTGHVGAVIRLARSYPEATFVVDYLGPAALGAKDTVAVLERLAGCPNIWLKMLAWFYDSQGPPYLDLRSFYCAAIASFGFDRLVMGTDWPNVNYQEAVAWLSELPCDTESGRRQVWELSAAKLWSLHV